MLSRRDVSNYVYNLQGTGGALYIASYARADISGSHFVNNSCDWYGGAIASYGQLVILDTYMENSQSKKHHSVGKGDIAQSMLLPKKK